MLFLVRSQPDGIQDGNVLGVPEAKRVSSGSSGSGINDCGASTGRAPRPRCCRGVRRVRASLMVSISWGFTPSPPSSSSSFYHRCSRVRCCCHRPCRTERRNSASTVAVPTAATAGSCQLLQLLLLSFLALLLALFCLLVGARLAAGRGERHTGGHFRGRRDDGRWHGGRLRSRFIF